MTLPDGTPVALRVRTETACLAVMDAARAAQAWEPLLLGQGSPDGVAAAVGGAAVHLDHDGWFPVRLVVDGNGSAVGFEIDLDPYAQDIESFRGLAAGEQPEAVDGDGTGPVWAEPVVVEMSGSEVLIGDPASVPDGGTELLTVSFGDDGGSLALTALLDDGRQVLLSARWQA